VIDTAKEREWAVALGTHAAPDDGPDEVLVGVVLKNTWEIRNAGQALRARYLAALDALDAQAAEIERLKGERDALRIFIAEINNRWRHDWAQAVDEATDTLFKRMSAHAALSEREPCATCGGTGSVPAEVDTNTGPMDCPYIGAPCPDCHEEGRDP